MATDETEIGSEIRNAINAWETEWWMVCGQLEHCPLDKWSNFNNHS